MRKNTDFGLLAMVILIYSTVCMETDIYVPAFPDMRAFFAVTDEQIQKILSWNFVGICIGSLLFAALSDSLGRKKPMIIGLGLFFIASWGCVLIKNFDFFLVARFVQGIGAAAPMAISFAIILDKYDATRSAQLCGILNIFIAGVMAGAPILGSILNLAFGWQANFRVIALLATASFMGSFYGVPETLTRQNRLPFSYKRIAQDYVLVATSFPYMAGTIICYLLFASVIMFIANLSLIFIEYLGVPKSTYGFYQASTMFSFALFSFLSVKVIGRFGMDITKQSGLLAAGMGAMLLCALSYGHPDPIWICATMFLFTAGVTFAAPIYSIEAANILPQLRGISAGMNNALRHLIVAAIVAIGGSQFNGSIQPVAQLIGLSTVAVFILVFALQKKKRLQKQSIPGKSANSV